MKTGMRWRQSAAGGASPGALRPKVAEALGKASEHAAQSFSVAARYISDAKAEARKRQYKGVSASPGDPPEKVPEGLGDAREHASQSLSVNHHYVSDAKAIARKRQYKGVSASPGDLPALIPEGLGKGGASPGALGEKVHQALGRAASSWWCRQPTSGARAPIWESIPKFVGDCEVVGEGEIFYTCRNFVDISHRPIAKERVVLDADLFGVPLKVAKCPLTTCRWPQGLASRAGQGEMRCVRGEST